MASAQVSHPAALSCHCCGETVSCFSCSGRADPWPGLLLQQLPLPQSGFRKKRGLLLRALFRASSVLAGLYPTAALEAMPVHGLDLSLASSSNTTANWPLPRGCRGTGATVLSAQRSQSQHGTGEMCFIKSQLVGIVTATFPWLGVGWGGGHSRRVVTQLQK